MRLEWRGRTLVITWLPVGAMGRLAALAPASPGETEVLAALLAGARVCLERKALEYRLSVSYTHLTLPTKLEV